MKIISISITQQLLTKLKDRSKETGLAVSDIIRQALTKYFEN